MKRSYLLPLSTLWLLASGITFAIIDTNENTVSDLWEKQYNNGELSPSTFDPEADPDQDGWTNAEEAAAGTDPENPNPPDGLVQPEILHTPAVIGEENGEPVIVTPEVVTVSWPTLVGKQYTLHFSPDLTEENWTTIDEPFIGDGDIHEFNFLNAGAADKRFWRVAVEDTDTDGDTLTNAEEHALGTNPNSTDTDYDGKTDEEEVEDGTNPSDIDTDLDGLDNAVDAVPTDGEINWEKTSESRYVWLERETTSGYPLAVNSYGKILFDWQGTLTNDSTSLEGPMLDSFSNEEITLPARGSGQSITPLPQQLIAISDSGLVAGRSQITSELASPGNEYPVDNVAGMIWRPQNNDPKTYDSPRYFMPEDAWIIDNEEFGIWRVGGVARDGSVNCLGYLRDGATTVLNWDIYDSASQTNETRTIATLTPEESGFPGAILDANRCLFVHKNGNNNANADALYYWDGQQRSTVGDIVLGAAPENVSTSLSALPGTLNEGLSRVWLSATGGQSSEVRIECRDSAGARWHKPASMPRGAYRLNRRGEAITRATSAHAPQIWRNGEYADLDAVSDLPDGFRIEQAIDIASNGIILAQASNGGGWKTGLLVPVDITVAFGLGAETLGDLTSRELLEAYLNSIKVLKEGNFWFVKHTDAQGEETFFGVEVVDSEEKLIAALARKGSTVIFDGHSNFGLGPNFSGKVTHKTINDFTHFGVGKTSIPVNFRGDGSETDVVPFTYADGTTLPSDPDDLAAIGRVQSEGWAYLVLHSGQIVQSPKNYVIEELGIQRFDNLQGVSPGGTFIKQGTGFNNEWHFDNLQSTRRLIVKAPDSDVPQLGYKRFFYNACITGRDYIESFEHGDFFFTKDTCKVEEATKIFVQGIVEGKSNAEILSDLNQDGVGNQPGQSPLIYEVKSF